MGLVDRSAPVDRGVTAGRMDRMVTTVAHLGRVDQEVTAARLAQAGMDPAGGGAGR